MKSTTLPSTLTSATYEELVREMIVRLGEDPDREGHSISRQRLQGRSRSAVARGAVRGQLRRDGDRERHRNVQPVRAPPFAVLWQGARGLYSERKGDRPEQNTAPHRSLLAPLADPGAADHANCGGDPARRRTAGRRCCHRGPASVHDDAWRRKTAFFGGNFVNARLLPQRRGNANRILVADPPAHECRVICKFEMQIAGRAAACSCGDGRPRPSKPSAARQLPVVTATLDSL